MTARAYSPPPYFIGWEWINTAEEWYEKLPGFNPDPMVKADLIAEAQGLMRGLGYGPDNPLEINILCSTSNKTECEGILAHYERDLYIKGTVEGFVDLATRNSRRDSGDFTLEIAFSNGVAFPRPGRIQPASVHAQHQGRQQPHRLGQPGVGVTVQ